MSPDTLLLVIAAASIAFLHTLLGVDHYLPFVALARARKWSMVRTLRITALCGLGHLAGSVLLGVVGISIGARLGALEWLENLRGLLAAWLLIGFGLAYAAWGLRMAWRKRPHSHWHYHDDMVHRHAHDHRGDHAHLHEREVPSFTPWILFVIFILGPCEPLIPLLMYPAATGGGADVLLVAAVFGMVTVATMLAAVAASICGLRAVNWQGFERFGHAIAGMAIFASGAGIVFLGI